jgi:hypothetical protein
MKSSKVEIVLEKLKLHAPDKMIRSGFLTYIGKDVGLSRERIRQIANQHGYQPSHETSRKLKIKNCYYCGNKFSSKYYTSKFCTNKCRIRFHFYKHNTLEVCTFCKLGYLSPTSRRGEHLIYCSKTCQGKDLAKNFGWGSPRDNRKPKYISIDNVKDKLKEPFTTREFAVKFGYSSFGGAYSAVNSLKFLGVIVNYKVKGIYIVKN